MSRRMTFWIVQLVGWSTFGLVSYFAAAPELPEFMRIPYLLVRSGFTALGLCFSSLLYALYVHRMPRFRDTAPMVVFVMLACSVLGFAWHLVYRLALPAPYGGLEKILEYTFLAEAATNIFVLLAWSAAYLGLTFLKDSNAQQQAVVEAKALAHEAQLRVLQYQLNPHFLFNALNSVRALIRENPDRASVMVTQLAEFLRFGLTDDPLRTTQLHAEIDALQKYLAIERTRFEDKLQLEIDIEPGARDCAIPRLLLHPLLENAIKHGMRTSPMPLRIVLRASMSGRQLRIEVANTGELVEAEHQHEGGALDTGIGLTNVRERLAHAFPDRHDFCVSHDGEWVRAVLTIDQTPSGSDAK